MTSLSSQAYRHLHQQLATGALAAGAVLSEKKLAHELGISRTPVSDAVRRLASEGLVEQVPRYGTVVKEIAREDMTDIYELREVIEPYAAGKAARSITPTQLKQLAVLCQTIDELEKQLDVSDSPALEGEKLKNFLAADLAFHLLIVQAAGNARLLKVIQSSRGVSQIFRVRRARHDSAVVHAACDFHSKILAALSAGDADAASDWMLKHIQQSKATTMAFIDSERGARPQPEFDLALELSDDVRAQLEKLERDGK